MARRSHPDIPKKLVSLQDYDGKKALTSPRSLEVLRTLGILSSDLQPFKEQEFSASFNASMSLSATSGQFSATALQLRREAHERKRQMLLVKARARYEEECNKPLRELDTTQGWNTVSERRDQRNQKLAERKALDTAKRLLFAVQSEALATSMEQKRQEKQVAREDSMRQRNEEQMRRNEEKRQEAERRIQAAMENERKVAAEKAERYHQKHQAQEQARLNLQENRRKENEMRHQQAEEKEQERKFRKEKAERELKERQSGLEQKIENQERMLREILTERDRKRQEKQLRHAIRNEGVKEAVERQRRANLHQREKLGEKCAEKASRVDAASKAMEAYTKQSRQLTQIDGHQRQMIGDWILRIGVTKSYDVPAGMDIDLAAVIPILEEEKKKHPEINVDAIIKAATLPTRSRKKARENIPRFDPQYWAKSFYDDGY